MRKPDSRFGRRFPTGLSILLLLSLGASAVAADFFDTFDDGDLSDWRVTHPVDINGPAWMAVPGLNLPPVKEGIVSGHGFMEVEYAQAPPLAGMFHPISLDGSGGFSLGMSAVVEHSGSYYADITIFLVSRWGPEWDGYVFHLTEYNQYWPSRIRIYRFDGGKPTLLGYHQFPEMVFWHSYEFSRGVGGDWRLLIDGRDVLARFEADTTYKRFAYIGMILGTGSDKIDWIRVIEG